MQIFSTNSNVLPEKSFSAAQILNFFRAADKKFSAPFRVIIIGGSAAGLAYGVTSHTRDIDTFQTENFHIFHDICHHICRETGMEIPVSEVSVADAPWHYEDRLVEITPADFRYLKIFVPERHDLILMKILRGNEHDFRHIREIAQKHDIEYQILLSRFVNEMDHVIGNPDIIRLSFLCVIEQLFGPKKADETEILLRQKSG